MADPRLLLLSLLSIFFSFAASINTSSPPPRTAFPHVPASLAAAVNLKSPSSLPFRPRHFLLRHTPMDYRSLTVHWLQRDEAHASAIADRVRQAIYGVKKSDLLPSSTTGLPPKALQVPVSQGIGEYFSRVGVGSPPMPLNLVPDTTSDITWIKCQPCTGCHQQSDPVFDPSASSSYAPVGCGSATCAGLGKSSSCRNNDTCVFKENYGDEHSFIEGDLATERFTLGQSSISDVAFGCGHASKGEFGSGAGYLGLSGSSLSFPSQIKAESFCYCFGDLFDSTSTSTLDFGSGIGESAVTAAIMKNPVLDTFYFVNMTGISVGGQMLPFPESYSDARGEGGIFVHSRSMITTLHTEVYNSTRDAFVKGTTDLPRADGVGPFDTCYNLWNETSVQVPSVAFHFPEGKELRLPVKNCLIPVDGAAGTFCFAFAPTSLPMSSIGIWQQQGTRVAFDLRNSVIGFEANKC